MKFSLYTLAAFAAIMLLACANNPSAAEKPEDKDTNLIKTKLLGTWALVVPDSAAVLAEGEVNFTFDKNSGSTYWRMGKDYGQVTDTNTFAFVDTYKWKFGKIDTSGISIITYNTTRKITEATGMFNEEETLTGIANGMKITDTLHIRFNGTDTFTLFNPQNEYQMVRKK